MPKRGSAVHVSTHRRHYVGKDGVVRDYVTHLLRRSYREDGKVKLFQIKIKMSARANKNNR